VLLEVDIQEAGYTEESRVIQDVNFTVYPGELVGLIGPNGAGKSSTIKAILGILKHQKGTIHVQDYGYIPERPIMYEGMTVQEHIDFLFTTIEAQKETFDHKAKDLLKDFQIQHVVHHFPENFSKGMQQKVMLVLAFLKNPSLYIIDEPFMGLDPKAMKRLLHYIQQEKERGAGVLMSTHVLDTAEKVCDRFILISNGGLAFQGTIAEKGVKHGFRLDGSGLCDPANLNCISIIVQRLLEAYRLLLE